MRTVHTKLALVLLASVAFVAEAQAQASYPCVNDAPNPYKLQSNWAQTPRPWAPTNAVTVDSKDNIWVFDRCGDEGCSKSNAAPIFHLSPEGRTIKNFGAGEFASAHGIAVDKDGNVWAADFQSKDGKGMQVTKFSPDGKVLLKLGKPGESGMGDDTLNQPSGLAVLSTGEILVAEGHGSKLNKSRRRLQQGWQISAQLRVARHRRWPIDRAACDCGRCSGPHLCRRPHRKPRRRIRQKR